MNQQNSLKRFAGRLRKLVRDGVRERLETLESWSSELEERVKQDGRTAILEQVTYTWFNRLVMLRHMELNGFLPPVMEKARLEEAILLAVKEVDSVMPTVLTETMIANELIPSNLAGSGGIVAEISRQDSKVFAQAEIIGWLYQYYNDFSSEKDALTATQVFTPDWVVRFLVDNSLKPYLQEKQDQNPEDAQWIEKVKFLDPCSGSGHILVYAFEVFYEKYLELGYASQSIPKLILENNLFGFEVDDRATQLTIVSCLMAARKYDSELFQKKINLNFLTVKPTNRIWFRNFQPTGKAKEELEYLLNIFWDAQEYGALIRPRGCDYSSLVSSIEQEEPRQARRLQARITPLVKQAKLLAGEYDVVVTNPPYMHKYDTKMRQFLLTNYPEEKSDLAIAFIRRALDFTKPNGYTGLITMDTWMYQKSATCFRERILKETSIRKMLHLGYGVFSSTMVSTTAFIMQKVSDKLGIFVSATEKNLMKKIKLAETMTGIEVDNEDADESGDSGAEDFGTIGGREKIFRARSEDFLALPQKVLAYKLPVALRKLLARSGRLSDFAEVRQGLSTANNERFLRLWWEVDYENIEFRAKNSTEAINSGKKWFPHNKGGRFQKWYGNDYYVINWKNDGRELREAPRSVIRNEKFFFRPAISWSAISNNKLGFRFVPEGNTFNAAGPEIFAKNEKDIYYILGILNSSLAQEISEACSMGWNKSTGEIAELPMIYRPEYAAKMTSLVQECIQMMQEDWNENETAPGFKRHPLCVGEEKEISAAAKAWQMKKLSRKNKLHENEKLIDGLTCKIFSLQESETGEEADNASRVSSLSDMEITKSLLSYFVGWSLGRYDLEKDGAQNCKDAKKFLIMSPEAGELDIILRLEEFLRQAFGAESLEDNLMWLAEALGKRGEENARGRLRRYFQEEFFQDHLKRYTDPVKTLEGRPIYWQMSSGPEKAFQAIFYVQKYEPKLLEILQRKYVEPRMEELQKAAQGNGVLEQQKRQWREMTQFDEWLRERAEKHIRLNLDDGTFKNFEKLFGISLRDTRE